MTIIKFGQGTMYLRDKDGKLITSGPVSDVVIEITPPTKELITIQKDVMSGQCKNALLRLQVRYTAIFFLPGYFNGYAGSQIGLFTPRKTGNGYSCTGFYFEPWFAKDVAVSSLPQWYRRLMRALSFRIK